MLFFLLFTIPAIAQPPEIGGLVPAGGPRGASTTVQISGKNLTGARIHLSGAGVIVKSTTVSPAGDNLTAELTVESSSRLGPREVRISTPKGASNGARFWVDNLPNQIVGVQAEDSPPITLDGAPIVVNGCIASKAARHRFAFAAAAGETWTFECFADRIRSRLDPVLEMRDESGRILKIVQSTWESDPRWAFKPEKAGRYLLTLRDSEFQGGPNFTYRMRAGRIPLVTSYSPLGERPGSQVKLAIAGASIADAPPVSITIPSDAPPGEFWTEVPMKTGPPVALPLLVDSMPVICVGGATGPIAVPVLPVALDGTFLRSPQARFTFQTAAKERYLFDLLGRRIDSRIDGALRVLDSSGKEIAANDDAIGKDARLEFAPPAAGTYTIEVRNVEDKTGPDCYYRLIARVVTPDFKVGITTDRINLPVGGTIVIPVTAERIGGFTGPIQVRVDGLPQGLKSSGGVIPPGKTSVEITLTAPADAPLTAWEIHIRGESDIGGRPVIHEATPWERYEHRSIDLNLTAEYSYTRPHHDWELLVAAVTESTEQFTLRTEPESINLAPGGKAEIIVRATRRAGMDAEIKLEIKNLPAKVTASAASIPAKHTEARISLTAAPDAPADISNVIVQGKTDKATHPAPAVKMIVGK